MLTAATVTHCANSDVSVSNSGRRVAVAVTCWPEVSVSPVWLKLARPPASVVTSNDAISVRPSPNPLALQAAFENN